MSILQRIKMLLDDNQAKYTVISHSPAFTAQEIASSSFISGNELAKTLILNVNGDVVMTVIPASKRLDIPKLIKIFGIEEISLAQESEFRNIFSECKTGAMPPFGNLFKMKTYASSELKHNKYITFNAGNHSELIRMKYSCFEKLVNPEILEMTIS